LIREAIPAPAPEVRPVLILAPPGFVIPMSAVAQLRIGRILLHLLAMTGDGHVRFHLAGIRRELSWRPQALE
jgi:hypothetical protein